jgi:hypothetical protein
MKPLLLLLCIVTLSCQVLNGDTPSRGWPADLPVYDHVVIVVEENKYVDQIVGSDAAPYLNGVLMAEGATLTRMFAEEHNSEGNYFWLFSGSNQGVGFHDLIPNPDNVPRYPFTSYNLGAALLRKGLSFRGYSEDLPHVGDSVSWSGHYARKHVPWISFANLPAGSSPDSSSNLQFQQFPKDFNRLPTVAIVIPNLIHDMHDPPRDIAVSVRAGDDWLRQNIGSYYEWAKNHNSLLIVTFDENADSTGYVGLTDPASRDRDIRNRIPTILAGAWVNHGSFPEGEGVTHVNLLRTLEAMYDLEPSGDQQPFAVRAGISGATRLTDVFQRPSQQKRD